MANRSSKPSHRVSGGSTHALGSGFVRVVDEAGACRRGGIIHSAATVSVAVVPEKAETILAELYEVRR